MGKEALSQHLVINETLSTSRKMTEKKWCNERQEEEEKEEGVPSIETLTFIVKFWVHIY